MRYISHVLAILAIIVTMHEVYFKTWSQKWSGLNNEVMEMNMSL